MTLWWLSFADPKLPKGKQFLGACIVSGEDMIDAVAMAHALKINPGGQVKGVACLTTSIPAKFVNVLMNREMIAELDSEMEARKS